MLYDITVERILGLVFTCGWISLTLHLGYQAMLPGVRKAFLNGPRNASRRKVGLPALPREFTGLFLPPPTAPSVVLLGIPLQLETQRILLPDSWRVIGPFGTDFTSDGGFPPGIERDSVDAKFMADAAASGDRVGKGWHLIVDCHHSIIVLAWHYPIPKLPFLPKLSLPKLSKMIRHDPVLDAFPPIAKNLAPCSVCCIGDPGPAQSGTTCGPRPSIAPPAPPVPGAVEP